MTGPSENPSEKLTRRSVLQRSALQIGGAALLAAGNSQAAEGHQTQPSTALVVGQAEGALSGNRVLAGGGNAVDAAVAAALVAGVVAVPACGIGGYGGHMVVGWPDGRVAAIDFNSSAPAAAHPQMFLDADGKVRKDVHLHGWLSAGVPGTLAGLQLALDRFGTRTLDHLIEPPIRAARDGFAVSEGFARAIRASEGQFRRDPASAALLLPGDKPLAAGERFRNPDLAAMLEQLAKANRVDDFYRGAIGREIAAQFQEHGGLVTAADLAGYQARVVQPLALEWCGKTIHTAPLTAGGLSVLQTLATLKALDWSSWDHGRPQTAQARIEAVRLAWQDRLSLLGDPTASDVPVERLLSESYAAEASRRVRDAVERKRLIAGTTDGRPAGGTVHLTVADKDGMFVAVTLTHGEGFGARVTVAGLGLILGHGMSRFDPRPDRPNSPRPGARPLNNMCPALVFENGKPRVGLGATGGRRIPNTLCDVLAPLVGRKCSLAEAATAPRLHTEGDDALALDKHWSAADREYLSAAGYRIQAGGGANLNGLERDASGALHAVP